METYTELKELGNNPNYQTQKQKTINAFSDDLLDKPIIEIIKGFNSLHGCFTLQSCYGHFIYAEHNDPHNFEPLPINRNIDKVEYRIAYIAFCIENSDCGRALIDEFKKITNIDPENIQFCCAEWFWNKQVNSYVLQVEPERFKRMDKAILNYFEALKIEKIRNNFFYQLTVLLQKHKIVHLAEDAGDY